MKEGKGVGAAAQGLHYCRSQSSNSPIVLCSKTTKDFIPRVEQQVKAEALHGPAVIRGDLSGEVKMLCSRIKIFWEVLEKVQSGDLRGTSQPIKLARLSASSPNICSFSRVVIPRFDMHR